MVDEGSGFAERAADGCPKPGLLQNEVESAVAGQCGPLSSNLLGGQYVASKPSLKHAFFAAAPSPSPRLPPDLSAPSVQFARYTPVQW